MKKAVIIDNEIQACVGLQAMIEAHVYGIKIIGHAHSVIEGLKLIRKEKPEIVFLKIEMGQETGFDLLEAFGDPSFKVIFVSKTYEYANKAIGYFPAGYLVKPANHHDLIVACMKAIELTSQENSYNNILPTIQSGIDQKYPNRISLCMKTGIIYVDVNDIVNIEADNSYSTFTLINGEQHVVSKNIKTFEVLLDPKLFFRSHKSQLVNLKHIHQINLDGTIVMANQINGKYSRSKKNDLINEMKCITSY